ncbi:hypothetical protein CgunFtcFv8_026911 [Champsocephalus gunnari]|uniref:Uncharacterized protein n=1 Tax=Champsocephalus gunnari TaxID=52237 RepID=A0AAN8E1F8_CHAGU|nr:hypothetical protein CgunFtcFv8_026911 [Champsocephalus gunnari]
MEVSTHLIKKKNSQLIKTKMEKTFSYRPQEILQDMPFITEFGERWPALFSDSEVNAEFTRITTVPLLPTFMSQLDRHSSQLMKVFKKKGGTAGRNLGLIMAAMDKDPTVETRRDCVLKALCVYMNESSESFINRVGTGA